MKKPFHLFYPIFFGFLFLIWMVTVFRFTTTPASTLNSDRYFFPLLALILKIPQFDKVLHFSMYAVATVLLWLSVETSPTWIFKRCERPLMILLSMVALAAVDEFQQQFVPGRSSDLLDFFADSLGVLTAFWLSRLFLTKRLSVFL